MTDLDHQGAEPSQGLRTHIIVLALGAAVVVLALGAYWLRRILVWIADVHHLFVFAFLIALALWGYWVTSALIRRKLGQIEAGPRRRVKKRPSRPRAEGGDPL